MISAQIDELRSMSESVGLAVPQAATLMMEAADTITELRGALQVASVDYRHLQAERDKLRELARELWFYAEQELVCDDNCPYGAACDWMEPTVVCVFKRRMRELGVEVDG